MDFPTHYNDIVKKLQGIKPLQYAATRNYLNGAVTYLSPYISRGVIGLPQVAKQALIKHDPFQIQKILQELAWREYWQRVWEELGDEIFSDIKQPQQNVLHHQMIEAIEQCNTGISIIDEQVQQLYDTGYMHNHLRMYVSSIACNVGKAHWLQPSQWMYYHLLDGDIASNTLSWQWVAGSFASKKYYCNQENINRYTNSRQQKTFLDTTYQELVNMPVPSVLQSTHDFSQKTKLPENKTININTDLPVLVYNSYNLDPLWHPHENANRILLLEPSHFNRFPVSDKVLTFIIALSANINNIQVYTGEFDDLASMCNKTEIFYKKHPAFTHYKGRAESYERMFPEVRGYFNSFSAYWKRCEKYIKNL